MRLLSLTTLAAFLFLAAFAAAARPTVTLSENDSAYTLDNGIVAAKIAKRSGDLVSLTYKNLEILDPTGHEPGYWSHNAGHSAAQDRITIDPKSNGGERAEVSIKAIAHGEPVGSGPGGSVIADVEIRYALGRDDSGVYTYCIFTHPTNYPATSIGEARFCLKLNDDLFDWMTVDSNRNMKMISTYDWNHGTPMNMKEARRMNSGIYKGEVEHKYDYSANQFDVRVWGWSSSEAHVGVWLVNPSVEYLSGGPTKFELSAHRDATFNTNAVHAPAPPTLLNYWRSSHYGGSICNIDATDAWTKVVGPFLIYCNSSGGRDGDNAADHNELWQDALAQGNNETAKWPFDWVNGVDYPHRNERATVTGSITLNDPQSPGMPLKHLLVGLTAPDYLPAVIPRNPRPGIRGNLANSGFGLAGGGDDEAAMTNTVSVDTNETANATGSRHSFSGGLTNNFSRFGTNVFRGRGSGLPHMVDWQIDAKNYQFWVHADSNGHFQIPNVRPGTYTLHAIADGVLGEFIRTNITVTPGQNLALRTLNWQPVRYGRQLWDIGIPNRSGEEFYKGDDYFHWGWYLQYPKLFPYDVKYVIGKSDFHKDWFFEQVPYNEDTNNITGRGRGSATTWTVTFNLAKQPHGKATLRLAICGIGARTLMADINDQSIGSISNLAYNAVINRDGITGTWGEHDLVFNAALMKPGTNVLSLTVPAGQLTAGIIYDYLRLELDKTVPAPK